jgi:hypothetical protein
MACCLIAALLIALSVSSCLTATCLIGTRQHDTPTATAGSDSESNQRQTIKAGNQQDRFSRVTSSPEAVSRATLEFQVASPRNSTRSSAPSTTGNTSRIVVPISRIDNASNIGKAGNKGFTFPTWLLILAAILVLVAVFGLLFLRLKQEGDRRPTVDAPAVLVVKPRAPPRAKRPSQIPIKAEQPQAERLNSTSVVARPRRLRRIPIDTPREQELEDDSR